MRNRLILDSQGRCLVRCASYLQKHWSTYNIRPLIITSSDETNGWLSEQSHEKIDAITLVDYVKGRFLIHVWDISKI